MNPLTWWRDRKARGMLQSIDFSRTHLLVLRVPADHGIKEALQAMHTGQSIVKLTRAAGHAHVHVLLLNSNSSVESIGEAELSAMGLISKALALRAVTGDAEARARVMELTGSSSIAGLN